MISHETQRLLDAYVDNELDLRGAVEVEEHLERCLACDAEAKSLRELQASARANLTWCPNAAEAGGEPARRGAREGTRRASRIRTCDGAHASSAASRRAWRWVALAPAAAAGALLTVAWPRLWPQPSEASVADAVVAAHVRSLLANHLTDVASSDHHTVKPWFQGNSTTPYR